MAEAPGFVIIFLLKGKFDNILITWKCNFFPLKNFLLYYRSYRYIFIFIRIYLWNNYSQNIFLDSLKIKAFNLMLNTSLNLAHTLFLFKNSHLFFKWYINLWKIVTDIDLVYLGKFLKTIFEFPDIWWKVSGTLSDLRVRGVMSTTFIKIITI